MWLSRILDELRASQFSAVVGEHCHGSHVACLVHIVGRREDRDQGVLTLMVVAVALRLDFMGPQGHPEAIVLHEVLGNIRAEEVDSTGHAAGRPIAILALGVGPKEVHHKRILIKVWLHKAIGVLDLRQADLDP